MFAAFLKALSLIPQLLPVIYAFVQQAENLLLGAPGTSKFATVLAGVRAFIAKIEPDANVITELEKLVEPLIEAAVAFMKASPTVASTVAAVAGALPATGSPPPAAQ